MAMPSPGRRVTGGPTSRACIPQAPLFLLKGTDCHLGPGAGLPQPLAPQRPGVDRATGHGQGPGQGRPGCQSPGTRTPIPLHMQCLCGACT